VRKYALPTAFIAALALTVWAVSAFVAGIVAILRDSKYLNDVMIPSLVILVVLAIASIRLALLIRRRMRGFAELS
jgi:hypothetical protein